MNREYNSITLLVDALQACRTLGLRNVTVTTVASEGVPSAPGATFTYVLDADSLRPSDVLRMQRQPSLLYDLDVQEGLADAEDARLADVDGRW